MADNFLSWGTLGTFAGAVAAVVLIVQFLKVPVDKLAKVSTRILVYAVSFVLLLAADIFTGKPFSLESVALCVFNAFLVALSAMSLYEQAIAEPEAKKNSTLGVDIANMLTEFLPQQRAAPIVGDSVTPDLIAAKQADAEGTEPKGTVFDTGSTSAGEAGQTV